MKPYQKAALAALFCAYPLTNALAQEDEQEVYSYATYFYCDVSKQERVDEIVKKEDTPIYNRALKDGKINGWGWLAHHTGGKWRRVQYHSAGSLGELLAAQSWINEQAGDDDLAAERGMACEAHDDYIWKGVAGSDGGDRGEAVFSVYYVCDESREERADEIVKSAFAPVFDRYVSEGKLNSWGWLSHWVGGKYRRLHTMSAADHETLLATRDEVLGELFDDSEVGDEFTGICGSHADYMWNVVIENP